MLAGNQLKLGFERRPPVPTPPLRGEAEVAGRERVSLHLRDDELAEPPPLAGDPAMLVFAKPGSVLQEGEFMGSSWDLHLGRQRGLRKRQ